jgi:hypothetical protein
MIEAVTRTTETGQVGDRRQDMQNDAGQIAHGTIATR